MARGKITRTIRCYIHEKERFNRMLGSVLRDFPEYISIPDGHTFEDVPDSRSCPKLLIKAKKQQSYEIVKRFYKPKY